MAGYCSGPGTRPRVLSEGEQVRIESEDGGQAIMGEWQVPRLRDRQETVPSPWVLTQIPLLLSAVSSLFPKHNRYEITFKTCTVQFKLLVRW